jgi:hypothetical protein
MNFLDPNNAADLWLLIVCLALIVIGIISVIYAARQQPPKKYHLNDWDRVAERDRRVRRNGYKSKIGAR